MGPAHASFADYMAVCDLAGDGGGPRRNLITTNTLIGCIPIRMYPNRNTNRIHKSNHRYDVAAIGSILRCYRNHNITYRKSPKAMDRTYNNRMFPHSKPDRLVRVVTHTLKTVGLKKRI